MDALVEGLMEELNCETVFTIPLFGGIPVYESVVVTWIIMAVVFLLCILLSRNLSVENPSRRQVVVETAIKGLNDFFTETVGEKGKAYIPYLSAIAIYIGIANLIGLLGFKPPTKDMNVTATLALMSIVLIEVAMVIAIDEGQMKFQPEGSDEWIHAVVGMGFVEIVNNRVTLLVETAEKPEEIDVRRAEEAKQRAEERLRQKQSIHEYYHSRAALARAMARLKATSGK